MTRWVFGLRLFVLCRVRGEVLSVEGHQVSLVSRVMAWEAVFVTGQHRPRRHHLRSSPQSVEVPACVLVYEIYSPESQSFVVNLEAVKKLAWEHLSLLHRHLKRLSP